MYPYTMNSYDEHMSLTLAYRYLFKLMYFFSLFSLWCKSEPDALELHFVWDGGAIVLRLHFLQHWYFSIMDVYRVYAVCLWCDRSMCTWWLLWQSGKISFPGPRFNIKMSYQYRKSHLYIESGPWCFHVEWLDGIAFMMENANGWSQSGSDVSCSQYALFIRTKVLEAAWHVFRV